MKFKVSGKNIEYLNEVEIEADNEEQAEEKYYEMWEEGMILVGSSDLEVESEEIK